MNESRMREHGFVGMSTFLLALFCACTSPCSREDSLPERGVEETPSQLISEKKLSGHNAPLHRGHGFIKTTSEDCEIRGGEYIGHKDILPQDVVDCVLPPQIRRLRRGMSYLAARQILGSVYDYLYRTTMEKPGYGLYSYVLIPVHSLRAGRFFRDLFKTTSFVELSEITFGNLNLIYLPTRADKLSSLIPKISDGSPPPAYLFAAEFYNYALAQRLLAQICTSPSEEIQDACGTDLSRGPYLFTFTRPASGLSPVPPPYLFVDLSSVHARAFGEFIAAYKEQVKRTDYSDRERIDNLRLRILSIILSAADWVGPIKGAIANAVHMVKEDGTGK